MPLRTPAPLDGRHHPGLPSPAADRRSLVLAVKGQAAATAQSHVLGATEPRSRRRSSLCISVHFFILKNKDMVPRKTIHSASRGRIAVTTSFLRKLIVAHRILYHRGIDMAQYWPAKVLLHLTDFSEQMHG
ncbi:hypothetical protein U9M48_036675 [Paspalum notatum var. saurae]|uniref:Uncharacterized protein n=1 Tax=Paspalum notatum var. saurae TaxID=547442 RepID=A0AAQ3UFN2_PASNO